MLYTAEYMKKWVHSHLNLVNMREVGNGLILLKYKNKVFYDDLWTPELQELRGTIVDEDFNVVMRPPTKIFNWKERQGEEIDLSEIVTWSRKVNGFMAQVTVRYGELLVATTGTMDSEFAQLAAKRIEPYTDDIMRHIGHGVTLTFEIVDASDPHIIRESEGVYLLTVRANSWESAPRLVSHEVLRSISENIGTCFPAYGYAPMGEVLEMAKSATHEGFVVYGPNKALKLKTKFYLTTKFIGRMKDLKLEKLLDDPRKFRATIDEEYYELVDFLVENRESFLALDTQGRIQFVRAFIQGELS